MGRSIESIATQLFRSVFISYTSRMSRFVLFLKKTFQTSTAFSQPISFDIGSRYTRISSGSKKFFGEPTCVALHQKDGHVAAVGNGALQMMGKTTEAVHVTFPVRYGKISDLDATKNFVGAVIQTSLPHTLLSSSVLHPSVKVSASSKITSTEQDAWRKLFQSFGYTKISFVQRSHAIFRSFSQQMTLPKMVCFLDIGAMSSEMSIFSQGNLVVIRSLKIGGENFTDAVIRIIKRQHRAEIGWQTAERVKREVGNIHMEEKNKKQMLVRGRDILSGLPMTVHVEGADFQDAFIEIAQELARFVQEVCQDAPPEVITQALEGGIFLTGGASLLPGLPHFFETHLKTSIHLSQYAFDDVVRGL
jgi:rod shape-determining protein MreB